MPLFRDLERCDAAIRRTDERGIRGYEGPLYVKMTQWRHPLVEAFVLAAQLSGHPFNPDYNGISQEGIAYGQATQRRGRRWSCADAFLRSDRKPASLTVKLDAQVHKVLIKDGKAVGVKLEHHGCVQEVSAGRVIICAGAINTPQLLMLSGIGNAGVLRGLGIPVVVDRPDVGQGLMEHPMIRFTYRVNRPTYNITGGVRQKLQFLARYLCWGAGPLSMIVEALGFMKTTAAEPHPDVQLHVLPFGWGVGDAANNTGGTGPGLAVAAGYPCLSVLVNKNHPLSRGQVRLSSPDPKAKVLIEPRLLDRHEDVETLVRSIAMVRDIIAQPAVAPHVVEEVQPGAKIHSGQSKVEFVKRFTEIAAHPAGTCRMGVDPSAVVTPKLEVRGIRDLYIGDASVMPDLISGNTNAACMMIGDKLGRMLTAEGH
jgi:choline dehydrogenase